MIADQSNGDNIATQTNVDDNVELDNNGNPVRGPVNYSSYSKVVGTNKKLQHQLKDTLAKLEAFELKEKELEEKRLAEQGEYKKLLELEKKKRIEEENKRAQSEGRFLEIYKLNAVKEKLPGTISRAEYYSHIDLDKIAIDPETGLIDDASVQEVANLFVRDHFKLLDHKAGKNLPQNAATGAGEVLTYESWLKLPLAEQKLRRKEVMENWKSKKF